MSLPYDPAKAKVRPSPTRPLEAFIPPEEVYDASTWGRFEKQAFSEPPKQVCVCNDGESLRKRYLELTQMAQDPMIPHEQRRRIADEAAEVLDDLMKGSSNYADFLKWKTERAKGPSQEEIKGTGAFKAGIGTEARRFRRL